MKSPSPVVPKRCVVEMTLLLTLFSSGTQAREALLYLVQNDRITYGRRRCERLPIGYLLHGFPRRIFPDRREIPPGVVQDTDIVAGNRLCTCPVGSSGGDRQIWQPRNPCFSKYRWWYSSALQKVDAGTISVAIGMFPYFPDLFSCSFDASAAAFWSGVW
jgi:hypothetical protein